MKTELESLYNKSVKTVSQEDDVFCKTIMGWICSILNGKEFISDIADTSSLRDGERFTFWINYIQNNESSINSLLYRNYLFQNICDAPISHGTDSLSLNLILKFLTLGDHLYFPLYSIEVWSKIDLTESFANQLTTLNPEIKREVVNLANRSDITEFQLSRDHASLSSHALLYGLYLICVCLSFRNKTLNTKSGNLLLNNITQTLTNLKGVLFHVTD